MGGSNSRFKRRSSQYGSVRSVAFSLPPNWDRHSYAYGEPLDRRESSPASSTAGTLPKPILRNHSIAGASDNLLRNRNSLGSNGLSRSMHSLHAPLQHQQNRRSSSHSSNHNVSHTDHLSQRQYSDIYLKNDLRRVFRTQDRSRSVADLSLNAPQSDFDSAAGLDRRLSTLKAQRDSRSPASNGHQQIENRKEGATEKKIKSRKSKRAPLPNGNIKHTENVSSTKMEGLYRKKGFAPQPPLQVKARSLSSLVTENDDALLKHHGYAQQPLFQAIESELERRNIPMPPTREDDIEIPRPDYDGQKTTPRGVLVMPPQTGVKLKKTKPKAPPKPIKVDKMHTSHSDAIDGDLSGKEVATQSIVAAVEVHCEPVQQIAVSQQTDEAPTTTVPTTAAAPTTTIVPATTAAHAKKEVREIAIQYDAPVEIAIQCSGNTLKQRSVSTNADNSSLSELLQMFNDAIKAGKADASLRTESTSEEKDDTESMSSKASSSCERNAAQQKVVPMHQVLATVPEPPPLPEFGVKLIQKRTINDDAPVSIAPGALPDLDDRDRNPMDTPPRSFSTFQQQLMTAYEKIEQKRKTRPTHPTSPSVNINNDNLEPLGMFQYSDTILGIQTPHEAESDSGHDEPSDSSNSLSQSDRTPSIPDFVLAGIVKSIHTEFDDSDSRRMPVKLPEKSDKSKFNSIKRLKKSVRQLMISKRHSNIDGNMSETDFPDDQPMPHVDSNWTLSGRNKSSRLTISTQNSSPSADRRGSFGQEREKSPTSTMSSHSMKSNPSHFKQTNMKSFSLLTPSGYPGTAPKQHQSVPPKAVQQKPNARPDHSIADVPL